MFHLLQPTHLVIVAVVILVCIGPKKLPELAKGIGQSIREFKNAGKELAELHEDQKP